MATLATDAQLIDIAENTATYLEVLHKSNRNEKAGFRAAQLRIAVKEIQNPTGDTMPFVDIDRTDRARVTAREAITTTHNVEYKPRWTYEGLLAGPRKGRTAVSLPDGSCADVMDGYVEVTRLSVHKQRETGLTTLSAASALRPGSPRVSGGVAVS